MTSARTLTRTTRTALIAGLLASCGAASIQHNLEPVREGHGYQAQYRALDLIDGDHPPVLRSTAINAERCLAPHGGTRRSTSIPRALQGQRLSRDDLLDVRIAGDDTFEGRYTVAQDGTVHLPFLPRVQAQGRSVHSVQAAIGQALIQEGFYTEVPRISVRVTDYAAVQAAVSGAVFEPRGITIGGASGDDIDAARQEALGASSTNRTLSAALRSAGGVRPDADLSAVHLTRAGIVHVLDLRAMAEGNATNDVVILADDQIEVPSLGCFQDALMRPSTISPPGISLYLSNLTVPAVGNASSGIGREVRQVPYGTRYMQAVVNSNCVGGTRATSAARSAVLFTRNPMTGISAVIERDIETLLHRADRDDYDPYLLPGDAVACYDSAVTNVTDIAAALGVVLGLRSLID
jgi:polysaccharide export outer membrane protein